jgi:glycogen synthase
MKILHLIYDDINNPWLGGGGAVRTYEIYKRLSERHKITVITGNYPNAIREEEKDGILYKRIGSGKNYLWSRLTYSLNAPKLIKKSDCDIVIEDFSAFSPIFSPLHTKKPVIASIQNLYGIHAIKKYTLLGFVAFIFEIFGLKLYENYIVVSSSIEKKLKSSNVGKINIIPNGVDNSLLHLATIQKNYILFLGRIDIYQKGIDVLLKSFSKITEHEKIKLILAGNGKKKDITKLKYLIEIFALGDRVDFLGKVSEQKKKELLSNCMFVCMPSRFESWGMVAIEAAACEKPIIGAKIPGLCDAVKDGETGILVKPDNSEELFQAMVSLIENKSLRIKFGKNGRRWAQNFNWDIIAQTQEDFYSKCIK